LVKVVRRAVPADVPVTVKHRAGWDERHKNAPEFACALVEAGAAMITVHGRTRTQGFGGRSDLDVIRKVRDAVPRGVPVVGNGDVVDLEGYRRMRGETGCDAVMIGRGALGNPFLFAAIGALERGEPVPPAPTIAERRAAFERHVELIVALTPAKRQLIELRKACAWYGKGMHGGGQLRARAWSTDRADDVVRIAREFWDHFDPLTSMSRVPLMDRASA
jgi:tRNA-dihydrouridine synthase B